MLSDILMKEFVEKFKVELSKKEECEGQTRAGSYVTRKLFSSSDKCCMVFGLSNSGKTTYLTAVKELVKKSPSFPYSAFSCDECFTHCGVCLKNQKWTSGVAEEGLLEFEDCFSSNFYGKLSFYEVNHYLIFFSRRKNPTERLLLTLDGEKLMDFEDTKLDVFLSQFIQLVSQSYNLEKIAVVFTKCDLYQNASVEEMKFLFAKQQPKHYKDLIDSSTRKNCKIKFFATYAVKTVVSPDGHLVPPCSYSPEADSSGILAPILWIAQKW